MPWWYWAALPETNVFKLCLIARHCQTPLPGKVV